MEGEGTVGRGSRGRRSGPRVPPEGKRRGRGAGQGAQPRLWVGQDVLARWSDGLLYLGKVRKVNRWKQMCLVRFEDNSEFWELWKDIYPPALPGMEGVCCLCGDSTLTQTNLIVNCGKCNQGYHQECHAPPINMGTTASTRWICRPCVFAVATKKGGALKKGPYANAMRLMKRVLPYQLESLDWDPQHLSNQQQCYCYCGGPGEWNVKMLQCFRCQHWFHEACTQCLSKPLLYGDRFYLFLCCVCTAGPEYVIRLSLAWVDIAHLVLYHLTSCCRRKYFDFEQEILAFANENWDNLLVGELSCASKTERYDHLLETLNAHRDRFVSGKEIKKRKCIFGLQERVPPPPPSPASLREGQQLLPPPSPPHTPTRSSVEERRRRRVRGEGRGRLRSELLSLKTRRARRLLEKARSQEVVKDPSSANQTYQGSRGSASTEPNTSHTQRTPPKMMFASIQPSTNAVRSLESSSSSSFDYGDGANVPCLPQARETEGETETEGGEEAGWGAQGETASPCDSSEEDLPLSYLCSSVNTYFGAVGRLGRGETVRILARRHTLDNKVQYLVEWGGSTIF